MHCSNYAKDLLLARPSQQGCSSTARRGLPFISILNEATLIVFRKAPLDSARCNAVHTKVAASHDPAEHPNRAIFLAKTVLSLTVVLFSKEVSAYGYLES